MTSFNRVFVASIPSHSGEPLLFRSLTGEESLSALYEFNVTLLCASHSVDLNSLLGKSLTLEIDDIPATPRYLNGVITSMSLSGREASGNRYYLYQATVRPGLWYATQNQDFRIFQEKTVPEIVSSVLGEYQIKVESRLSYAYRPWLYCVQYQESDFSFLSRLLEHEGIYYYFTHQQDGHTLVLADAPQGHDILAGYPQINYRVTEGGLVENESNIQRWQVADSITPSRLSADDYDFRKPRARLLETRENPVSHAGDKAQIFEWPGGYINASEGSFYTRVRQQEQEARHELASGVATSLGVAPGCTFTLGNAPRPEDERDYLTIRACYFFHESGYASEDDDTAEHRIEFGAAPAAVNWRPARTTAWPKTHGPQTAEVVGPAGESIWTDKYGRVKLKFRWDRYASGDDTSSCWVRVSSAWAGWKYGAVQIPRVGEEVVVDFINGDPDRPLITGRVYNEDNMPPWDLPSDATKMGITSRTKDGNPATANYLSLEDAAGTEAFDMHAERDMAITVENNMLNTVGVNQVITVGVDQITTVGVNQMNTVGANMTETVIGEVLQTYAMGATTAVTATAASLAHTSIDGSCNKIIAAGLRAAVIGADFNVAGMRGEINPVFLGVSSAKILADNVVLDTYKAKIQAGKIALVCNDLTVFL